MLTDYPTIEFLGLGFADLSYGAVIDELDKLSQQESFSYVVTPNVDHVVMLHEGKDQSVRMRFREACQSAALRLCDSRILQLLARLRGVRLEVITGSDLTATLFAAGHFVGKKVAIIGGDEAMLPELRERFPEIDLVQHIPPMGVLRNQKAGSDIESFLASHPCHYALLAFGAPQSEIIAHECLTKGRARGVALCVGASLEFILGRKTRAPSWIQKARLEWFFRLMSEPRRLWRRYLVDGPKVVLIVLNA